MPSTIVLAIVIILAIVGVLFLPYPLLRCLAASMYERSKRIEDELRRRGRL